MSIFRSIAYTATLLAGATLIVTPVAAATRTVPITVPLSARPAQVPAWSSADETFNDHRWRGHRRHHDGFDGGDLLTVLLIGGGIAAVTSAIGNDQEKRRADRTDGRAYPGTDDRQNQYRSDGQYGDDGQYRSNGQYRSDGTRMPDQDYGRAGDTVGADRPYDYREGRDDVDRRSGQPGSREVDQAVDACSAEAARAGEVDEIFDVEKIDGEWRVKGDFRNGREFTCSVDGNGKAYVARDN